MDRARAQARAEAHAEAEAAAEQRLAAELARERTELNRQARSLLCTRGSWLRGPSRFRRDCIDRLRDGCTCSACGSLGHEVVVLLSWRQACLFTPCYALLP